MFVSAVAPLRMDSSEFDYADRSIEIEVSHPKSSMIGVRFVDLSLRVKITILMELLDWLFDVRPSSRWTHQHTYRTGRCYDRTLTCAPNDCAEKQNEVDSFHRTTSKRPSDTAQTGCFLISPMPSIRRDNERIS